jgi:hypothetical protein
MLFWRGVIYAVPLALLLWAVIIWLAMTLAG